MPKKPFSAEEIAWQRERIMDSAATVMADLGFHALSMRKLASALSMTASNIYNYFPGKESLLLNIRRRGFELLFQQIRQPVAIQLPAAELLEQFVRQLIGFCRNRPGYYQLMFQAPRSSTGTEPLTDDDQGVAMQLERLQEEWQRHTLALLEDVSPALASHSEAEKRRVALFFLTSIHGLVDCYHYRSLPMLMNGLELIPDDVLQPHIHWLLSALDQPVSALA